MGKPKKTKEEIKEKKRLAARQRRERIKNDANLYEQSKQRDKERYDKRKRDKKLLPISEMSPKNRKKAQKRNRENFRAYYRRQKEKKKLETVKIEMIADLEVHDDDIRDSLEAQSPSARLNESTSSLPSRNCSNSTENPNSKEETDLFQLTSFNDENVPLKKELDSNPNSITSPRPSCAQSLASTDGMVLHDNIKQLTEDIDPSNDITNRESSSCASPPSHSFLISKKSKRKMSALLSLRRHLYKINREMSYMRKKIEELKREKEKYRKQAFRLKHKKMRRKRQKTTHGKENKPDDDSNSSLKFSSEVWRHFKVEEDTATCTVCQKVTETSVEEMRSHLEEEHPGVMIGILKKPGVDDASDDERSQEHNSGEDTFTEVVYLEEETQPQPKRYKPTRTKIRQTFTEEKPAEPRIEYKIIQQKPDQQKPEIETFLNYVGCLLKNVPKDSYPKLQLDIISLIVNAQMASNSKQVTAPSVGSHAEVPSIATVEEDVSSFVC